MKASFVSSSAISQAMRYSMLRMQAELAKAEKVVSSGWVADVGLALGARTAQSVSLARDVERQMMQKLVRDVVRITALRSTHL